MSLFLLFLGKIFHQLNLEWYWQKLLAGTNKENSQIFNKDFFAALPSSMLFLHFTRYFKKLFETVARWSRRWALGKKEKKRDGKSAKFYNIKTELFNLSGKEESWWKFYLVNYSLFYLLSLPPLCNFYPLFLSWDICEWASFFKHCIRPTGKTSCLVTRTNSGVSRNSAPL